MEKWRNLQTDHMSSVQPAILAQLPCEIEDEPLFLPSHFSETDRLQMDLTQLAEEEAQLRKGQAYEYILQLRRVMKIISTLHGQRKKQTWGQRQNTRARLKIQSMEYTRDRILEVYNSSHHALKLLGKLSSPELEEQFPYLTVPDLFRKSVQDKRQLGDTHRPDGRLWVAGTGGSMPNTMRPLLLTKPFSTGTSHTSTMATSSPAAQPEDVAMTNSNSNDVSTMESDPHWQLVVESGKLWSPILGLTDAELEDWEREGGHCRAS